MMLGDERESKTPEIWVKDKATSIAVHAQFFSRGIMVLKPRNGANTTHVRHGHSPDVVSHNSFTLREREFCYPSDSAGTNSLNTKAFNKGLRLTTSLSQFIAGSASSRGHAVSLLPPNKLIFNRNRREEIFFPMVITAPNDDSHNLYVHPWLSQPDTGFESTGFSTYVSAACLFGAALEGVDDRGTRFQLIKHNHEFYPGQKITSIYSEPDDPNPYEITLMDQMRHYAHFIRATSCQESPRLHLHLPGADYILFGLNLYVTNKMTLEALGMFIYKVIEKQAEYERQMRLIFEEQGIDVTFSSPFGELFHLNNPSIQGIFSELSLAIERDAKHQPDLYERLASELIGLSPFKIRDCEAALEEKFINSLIQALKHLDVGSIYGNTWNQFLQHPQAVGIENIQTLEDIFKIANAVFVGSHSKNKKPGEVCSVLPLSEKPIQLTYTKYCKYLAERRINSYPSLFNATVLETVVPYGLSPDTGIFNFGINAHSLSNLLREELIPLNRNIALETDEEREAVIKRLTL